MTFYPLRDKDILNISIDTHPFYAVNLHATATTGSIFLEKKYLEDSLEGRLFYGFSARLGGFASASSPFSSSIEMVDAQEGTNTDTTYKAIKNFYSYYSIFNTDYSPTVTGSTVGMFRVINIPQIYYDRGILTGSLTASDWDAFGDLRTIYDNGRGGLYSGSLSGTLVGNIFYSEGIACLYKADLLTFGAGSSTDDKWRVSLKGTHKIPVKIFNCRAPAGELNATNNPTFYDVPTSGKYKNERQVFLSGSSRKTYITKVGLYNENHELVAVCNVAQPIRKNLDEDILFRIRLDW